MRPIRLSLIADQLEWERQHWLFYHCSQMIADSGFRAQAAELMAAHAVATCPKWQYAPLRMPGFSFREPEPTDIFQQAREAVDQMEMADVRLLAGVKPKGTGAQREIHAAFVWSAQQRIRQEAAA